MWNNDNSKYIHLQPAPANSSSSSQSRTFGHNGSHTFVCFPEFPNAGIGTNPHRIVIESSTQTLSNKTLTSPTLTTPILGTPQSGDLKNCTFPTLNQNTSGSAGSVANALTAGTNISFSSGTTYDGSSALTMNVDD